MIAKKFRLRLRQHPDFFNYAQRVESPFFRLYLLKSDSDAIAIITPKKAFPKAVDRHSAKRKIAAAYASLVPLQTALSVAVVAKPIVLTKTPNEIKTDLYEKLSRISH